MPTYRVTTDITWTTADGARHTNRLEARQRAKTASDALKRRRLELIAKEGYSVQNIGDSRAENVDDAHDWAAEVL
jgi:hypothetical protein